MVNINIKKHERNFIDGRGNIVQDPKAKKATKANMGKGGGDTSPTEKDKGDEREEGSE